MRKYFQNRHWMVWKPKKGPLSKSNLIRVRCRTASASVKHWSVAAAVAEDRSENEKHQRAEAGEEVLKVLEWPADAAKSGYCRPPGHCHLTMSRYVYILTCETIYCACYRPTPFHNQAPPLAYYHRRHRRLRRPKVARKGGRQLPPPLV